MGSGSKRSRRAHDDSESISEEETDVGSEMESEENDIQVNLVQKDADLEELEKEYSNLRNQQQDLLESLKRHKDEDILKGQAVKNQKVLWDKTLELRFLLQRAFSSSNKLPPEPLKSQFCSSDKEVTQAYSDLISTSEETVNCLLELQQAMLENNPSITQVLNGSEEATDEDKEASNKFDRETDELWLQIYKMHCRIAPFRNSSVDKWQRKTQVTTEYQRTSGSIYEGSKQND